jgi:hypothetical protein
MKTNFILIFVLIFNLKLSGQNNPPQFTSEPLTAVYDVELYSYQITASDLDGDSISFIEIDIPEWLALFDTKRDTVYLMGTATEFFDTANVNIGITDGIDTTYQVFNIYLYCPNCGISIFSEPIDAAYINANYEYNMYAGDCDPGLEILFECDTLPAWLNLENTDFNSAVLSGIPAIADTGTYEIIIRAYVTNSPCPNEYYQLFDLKVLEKLTSINQSKINNFLIYPVPCKERLIINFGNNSYKNYNIRIYNTKGNNLLFINNIESYHVVDISFLPNGIYLLEILDENNNVILLNTFIKLR